MKGREHYIRYRGAAFIGFFALLLVVGCGREGLGSLCVLDLDCPVGTCVLGRCVIGADSTADQYDAASVDGAAVDAGIGDAKPVDAQPPPSDALRLPDSGAVCDGVSSWIGPEGGTVALALATGDAVLEIPPGALVRERFVCLEDVGAPPPGFSDWSSVVRVGSGGLIFERPATLTLSFVSGHPDDATIFVAESSDGAFVRRSAILDGVRARLAVSSLQRAFVGDAVADAPAPSRACARPRLMGAAEVPPSRVAFLVDAVDCEGSPLPDLETRAFALEDPDGAAPDIRYVVLPARAHAVFVTFLVDVSAGSRSDRAAVVEGVRAAMLQLGSVERAVVHVEIRLFDGAPSALLWRAARRDLQALGAELDGLFDVEGLDPSSRDLYGVLTQELATAGARQIEWSARNGGGAFTTGEVVALTSGADLAGRFDAATLAAAVDEVSRDRVGAGGTPVTLTVVDAGSARDIRAAVAAIERRLGATYAIAACVAPDGAGHRLELALRDGAQTVVTWTVEGDGFGPGCFTEALVAECPPSPCAGFFCGGCDETLTVCDPEVGGCVDHCADPTRCGDRPVLTGSNHIVACPDRLDATACGDGCVDVRIDPEHCGACDRACAGACVDGRCRCPVPSEESAVCGLNGRGERSRTCREGAWADWSDCFDPDECVDGSGQLRSCGLNHRGLREALCIGGRWNDDAECEDPDVCIDGEEHRIAAACGPNLRGISVSVCDAGAWGDDACEDDDECIDGERDERARACGLNGRGMSWRVCSDGRWPLTWTCDEPDACVDGTDRIRGERCGLNARGTVDQLCVGGAWIDVTVCVDPDVCADGITRTVRWGCGRNGRGIRRDECAGGGWVDVSCDDPDDCDDGAAGSLRCGPNQRGTRVAVCRVGRWLEDGPCRDDDVCADGDDRSVMCGLNGRGEGAERCVAGAWTPTGACDDSDECTDGVAGQIACGRNRRGERPAACENGRWTPMADCVDPDECEDGAAGERACGFNDRGTEARRCFHGQWQDSGACDDPDECENGATRRAPCGLNRRAEWDETCVDGQWTGVGDCPDPDQCGDEGYEELMAPDAECAGHRFRICEAGQWLDWRCGVVRIGPGEFSMGSPAGEACREPDEDLHTVALTGAVLFQTIEVTQGQWRAVTGGMPAAFAGCDACPVELVNWQSAIAFTNALSRRDGLEPCYSLTRCDEADGASGALSNCLHELRGGSTPYECRGWRLPTEAEWERAARAGTNGPWHAPRVDDVAWSIRNSGSRTHVVAQLDPNAWGLYDMLGNVAEWALDGLGPYPAGRVVNPFTSNSGANRVYRGGSWADDGCGVRAAFRQATGSATIWRDMGLRPVRTVP